MENLIVHIVLPKGIRTMSGAVLAKDTTFDVISQLDPYYASIDQVRLTGGLLMRKLSDITVACMIYNTSQRADLLCLHPPTEGDDAIRFWGARNNWVAISAAHELSLNMSQILGQKGAHVLANFSVSRQGAGAGEGFGARLKDMLDDIRGFEITIRSRGRIAPNGRPYFAMAAKGVADVSETAPGRTWIANGMGVNSKSSGGSSATGGRGKSVYFATGPFGQFVSGPVLSYSYGMHIGNGRPLPVTLAPHPGIL